MKRLIFLFLVVALCLSLGACSNGTGNADHDYILHLLENEEYDMAIYVIEGLRDGKQTQQPVQQQVVTEQQQTSENTHMDNRIVELVPDCTGTDWNFVMELHNDTGCTLTLESLITIDYMDDQAGGTACFEGADLDILPFGHLVLENGQTTVWNDMRPVDYGFNRREYQHIFRDEQGRQILFSFIFDMRGQRNENDSAPSAQQPSGSWSFPCVLENHADTAWELQAMDITHFMNEEPQGTFIFQGEDLHNVGLVGLVLQPGESTNWFDSHPAVSDWNAAEYRFHFMDGKGQPQVLAFRFDDLDKQNQLSDYAQDMGKDLKNLRHDVSFEEGVFPGVFWVPTSALGSSRYSNREIHEMLSDSPEAKQANISTLYEALQLYQVGNFTASDDNVRIMENGINWEHHKPGYHAVRTNTGCCATDSNWLHYILDGDYEEVGYIATSQRDGGGHVYNYIFQDGWYYFIDLTHYRASGTIIDNAVEDGDLNSYYATDYILGNIHKASSVQAYVDYVQQTFNDPPGLMFLYQAENVLAVEGISSASGIQITYEEANGQPIDVIFDDPDDNLTFGRAPSPTKLPDWTQRP